MELPPKEGAILVHGTIQGGDNPRIDHAWVEWPDIEVTWEPTSGTYLFSFDFREIFNAEALRRYTQDEARALVMENEHWGPWHEEMETRKNGSN